MTDKPIDFYRYRDAQGRDVITNDLTSVPAEAKATLEIVHAGDPSPSQARAAAERPSRSGGLGPVGLHLPSFLLGACTVAVITLVALPMRKAPMVFRMAIFAVLLVLAGSMYFGWVMRRAGFDKGTLADPRDAIGEAQKAKAKVDQIRALEEEIAAQKE